jgi:hypothetical protein
VPADVEQPVISGVHTTSAVSVPELPFWIVGGLIMRIGRKEALIALVAGIVPWISSRRANAQILPERGTAPTAEQFLALSKRVDALAAQIANQIAFAKDANGNATLTAPNVTITATSNLVLKAGTTGTLQSGGTMTVKGSRIDLN